MTWMSKGRYGTAHYVVLGAAVCSTAGRVIIAPTTAWRPYRDGDHRCDACRRHHPCACPCGRCSVVPLEPAHAPRVRALLRPPHRRPFAPAWRAPRTWGVWCTVPGQPEHDGWMHDGDPKTPLALTERSARAQAGASNRMYRGDGFMRFEARELPPEQLGKVGGR